jgi:hypothetical protein
MIRHKTLIGRYEWVAFPAQLLDAIPAKTDTGAYYTSIHAQNIKLVSKKNKQYLNFELLGGHPSSDYSREMSVSDFTVKNVSNSFGESEKRYAIKLKIKLANKIITTEVTLADRSKKVFPILLGRKLLNGRYLIDPSLSGIDKSVLKAKFPKAYQEDTGDDEQ